MTALDDALENAVIERHDGTPDYLACCGAPVDFDKVIHEDFCGISIARAELAALRARLEEAEEIISSIAHATYLEEISTAIGEAKDYIKCTS